MGKNPTVKTIKIIIAMARGECYFEDCQEKLVKEGVNVGRIAHIFPKKKSGPRGNHPDFPESLEERNKPENLLALCGTDHDIIDEKPEIYTVEWLFELKKRVEKRIKRKIL